MQSPCRHAGILIAVIAVCGPARAQELAPAGSGVSIHKTVIENGTVQTVKYYVTGGSPRLQALVRRIEWTENELSVVEQLQGLKLDTVVNERRIAAYRTDQLTSPFYPPGFVAPYLTPAVGAGHASPLQRSLEKQLACEATPAAALQLIALLEQVQTQLDAELKALPPPEQQAAKEPLDALRPRLAALPRREVPPQPGASTARAP